MSTANQLNRDALTGSVNVQNKYTDRKKGIQTARFAIVPTAVLGILLPKIPQIINPISGKIGIKYIIFSISYPFNLLNKLTSTDRVFLYIMVMMANPTATSAAATTIIKNTNI